MATLDPRKGAPGNWGILEAITAWLVIIAIVALVILDKQEGLIKLFLNLGPIFAGGAFLGYRMRANEAAVSPKRVARRK